MLFFKIEDSATAGNQAGKPAREPVSILDLGAPLALALIGIGLVVYAGPVYEFGQAAAEQLLQSEAYISAVLQAATGGSQP